MKKIITIFSPAVCLAFFASPLIALADTMSGMGSTETLITVAYWIPIIGFLVATIVMVVAVRSFGKSLLGSIFSYLLIGTAIVFVISVFQIYGVSLYGVSDDTITVLWHLMFYMAFLFYFFGLRSLIGLESADAGGGSIRVGAEKMRGLVALAVLAVLLVIPQWADVALTTYINSIFGEMGLHHFIAFALAGIVGYYLLHAKSRLGRVGHAIANPMIVAIFALSLQHLWELLNESWKVIVVASQTGESVERIFLSVAAAGLLYSAWRLKSLATG